MLDVIVRESNKALLSTRSRNSYVTIVKFPLQNLSNGIGSSCFCNISLRTFFLRGLRFDLRETVDKYLSSIILIDDVQ